MHAAVVCLSDVAVAMQLEEVGQAAQVAFDGANAEALCSEAGSIVDQVLDVGDVDVAVVVVESML